MRYTSQRRIIIRKKVNERCLVVIGGNVVNILDKLLDSIVFIAEYSTPDFLGAKQKDEQHAFCISKCR